MSGRQKDPKNGLQLFDTGETQIHRKNYFLVPQQD
jgi:hypothetical protein